jgi:hypothetical protein
VLRTLSLCTCCRHYPGAATGGTLSLIHPVVSAFPDRVFGSACASTFSRLARRSLALRPAHSRCHQFVTRFTRRLQPFRYLHSCSGCFRLERLPGGAYTRWKAPPFHGAHPFPSLRHAQARWQLSRAKRYLAYQQTSTPPREYRLFQAKYGGNRSPLRTML